MDLNLKQRLIETSTPRVVLRFSISPRGKFTLLYMCGAPLSLVVAPFPSYGLRTAGFDKQHQHTLRCPRFLDTGLLLSKRARDAEIIAY